MREGANASSCIVAYPTSVTTARAADALRAAGFANDDVIGASGSALAAHENAADPCTGILARLGQRWAAFVLAYAPEDGQTTRAADVLLLLGPAELHYYGAFTARSR